MLSYALRIGALGWLLGAASALEAPLADSKSSDRLVFCHFIVGIAYSRSSADDYDADMVSAKNAGIDAFALNIGEDDHTDDQLKYAYESAARNDMKVFISFDFTSHSRSAGAVGQRIAKFADEPAQLKVDGQVFVSSFVGDGLDVAEMEKEAGVDVFFVPNFNPEFTDVQDVDGAFNWQGWNTNGKNRAPTESSNISVEMGDTTYTDWLGDKPYMAPISPWFSTHFGEESSHSKNWVFPSGSLLYDRWTEVLTSDFQFVQIISWNDYGESHYIGPLGSPHSDDGSSKWVNDMPHNAWLDMSKPFISAYKSGDSSVNDHIEDDKIIYWYRRSLSGADCDSSDTTGRPDGYEIMDDVVYVVTLLTESGSLTIESGDTSETHDVLAGANLIEVPAVAGPQSFDLTLTSGKMIRGTSPMEITENCPCGLYNYNAYVGAMPDETVDRLQPDGLASFTKGLLDSSCSAEPSVTVAADITVTSPTATSKDAGGDGRDSMAAATTRPALCAVLGLSLLGIAMLN